MPLAPTPPGESKWKVVWNRAKILLGWVNVCAYNFFVCGPKFTVFLAQHGRGCSWSTTFPIFDMWIHSGDIRDQSRKLSEIAPNFRGFLPSQILGGGPSPKVVPTLTPLPLGTLRGKFRDVTPTIPKVIGANTLNFKPHFTCSPLIFWGTSVPVRGVC